MGTSRNLVAACCGFALFLALMQATVAPPPSTMAAEPPQGDYPSLTYRVKPDLTTTDSMVAEEGEKTAGLDDMVVPAATPQPWSFAVITDLHVGVGDEDDDYGSPGWDDEFVGPEDYAAENLRNAVELIRRNRDLYNIRFVMVTGDLTDSAELSEMNNTKAILDGLTESGIYWIPLIGNHDVWPYCATGMAPEKDADGSRADVYYNGVFSSQYELLSTILENWEKGDIPVANQEIDPTSNSYFQNFAFDCGGIHFIALDFCSRVEVPFNLGGGVPPEADLHDYPGGTWDWFTAHLSSFLASNPNKEVMLFAHHPFDAPSISGWGFSSSELSELKEYLSNHASNIFAEFCGHLHGNFNFILGGFDRQMDLGNGEELRVVETDANQEGTLARIVTVYPDGHIDCSRFAAEAFIINASASPPEGGKVTGAATYRPGDTVTLTAMANPAYHFVRWTEAGSELSRDESISFTAESDRSLVAEFAKDGGDTPGDATAFYFAEGYTGTGFQEYLCLGQPVDSDLEVTVTYLFRDGSDPLVQKYTVPGLSRYTVDVNGVVGQDKEVSIKCEADWPFVAERPMYFNYQGAWTGGHDVVGASETSDRWYFAEGYTGPGFEEWICVLNPGDAAAELTFRFQTQEEGEKVVEGLSVPPNSRGSFKANDLLGGKSYQTSLTLESTQPVVAERPMYFNYQGTGGWGWTGGHCVMGASSLASEYFFAEGSTRSGFEEWLTLQNPGGSEIQVQATYMLGTGETKEFTYPVPAAKRSTVYVPTEVGEGQDVSVRLACSEPFLAERPMYFDYAGLGNWGWTGGHCVIGATESATGWFLAEGYTGYGFEEWICIQNPGGTDASVTVTYYPEQGSSKTTGHTVYANSRYTVPVNADAGTDLAISTEVSSNQPVIVERPMYFSYGAGWTGGHDVVGFIP
jgi:hypothetical protein